MRLAVITGGTSGIGREVVRSFLEDGCSVIVVARRQEVFASLKRELANDHVVRLFFVCGDVQDATTQINIESEIVQHGGVLDVLVNSAGTISAGGIETESVADWNQVIGVNLTSVYTVTKTCLPYLKKSKTGTVVNISSVCSLRPCTSVSYSVSKAGIDMLTKVLAKDLAKYNIRVNAVNPGVVESNLQISAGLVSSDVDYRIWLEKMKPMHPLGRLGSPKDVASVVRFLCSADASWITGSIVSVDGGRALV
jgi:NAD(P)-dependent dehydrogenase (short-subunit alcohol dehydrogenase family)